MTRKRWYSIAPAEAYRTVWGDEQYRVQNLLLKQVNMPARIMSGVDQVVGLYEDRPYREEWREAVGLTRHKFPAQYMGDQYWYGLADEGLLYFAQQVAIATKIEMQVTGARMIRNTNVSSGYPVLYLEAVQVLHQPEKRRVYSGMEGPAVQHARAEQFFEDIRGMYRRGDVPR